MNKKILMILKALSLGASVGAIVCLIMDVIDVKNAVTLLAIGVCALSIASLDSK